MVSKLGERVALVTGGARRIGRAICAALAAEGCHVVIHYRTSRDEADLLCDHLRQYGVNAWAIECDLADTSEVEQLVAGATKLAGPIDFLINNASIFPSDHLLDFGTDQLSACVNVNAVAPLLLARALATQGRSGSIVNLLDTRVQDYDREHASYHLSKRMLLSLTSMLALELAPAIRVNGVAPGLILPPEGKDDAYLQNLVGTNPLRTYGGAMDVADAVIFLLRSTFVTGQVIYVDGGRHLKGRVYD